MAKNRVVVATISGRILESDLILEENFLATEKVGALKDIIAKQVINIPPSNIALSAFHCRIHDDELLSTYNINDGDYILVKNLGRQVSWKTVFILEYYGPIIAHMLVFFNRETFFLNSQVAPPSKIQRLFFICVIVHFIKRELETMFVHKFSKATMPISNLKKNCAYYSLLLGFGLALAVYSPNLTSGLKSPVLINLALIVWIIAQTGNFYTHLYLRNLRKGDSKERFLPRGPLFRLVCCPNYYFEILGWVALSVLVGSKFSAFCTLVGAVQMYLWAVKKHKNYKKLFGEKYKTKHVLIPYVL